MFPLGVDIPKIIISKALESIYVYSNSKVLIILIAISPTCREKTKRLSTPFRRKVVVLSDEL